MRLAFLTSTPLDIARGSGTYAGISTLARALERLGVEISLFTPSRHLPVYTLERLWFNEQIRRYDFGAFDAVIGFDMDGWSVAGRKRVPHIASIKGVVADEMRYESGWTRRTMAVQAACEARHVRRADLVLTTSRYAAGRIQELYGLAKAPEIVPECIDIEARRDLLSRNPAEPDPGRFTVLSVCRFYPRKRLDVLLRAAALLRSRVPRLELRIVGRGPEEKRLHALSGELSLTGIVQWLGDVTQADLAREYQRCHVFALPSVQEGFGIVFLEAMLAGKPVVAARAAAVPEVVRNGEQGLLVKPEDPAALAEALARVQAEPLLRMGLGEAGRRAVREYDIARVAGLFVAAVRSVTGG